LEERLPILRPLDSIVVEVDTQPLPPRPTDTAALYQALTAGSLSSGSLGSSSSLLNQLSPQSLPGQLSPQQLQQLQLLQQQSQQSGQPGQQSQQTGQAAQSGQQQSGLPPRASFAQGWEAGSPDLLAPTDPVRLAQLSALIRSQNPYLLS